MRESVTALLWHEGELLFIQRKAELSAFPGYTSFPGGQIEKSDSSHEEALFREVLEELGMDLNQNKPKRVVLLGEALTPKFNPRRFLNYFYLVELTSKPLLSLCPHEIEDAFWCEPQKFVKEFQQGLHLLVPPTLKAAAFLEKGLEKALALGRQNFNIDYDEQNCVPMIETVGGVKQLLPLSNTFPPANRTNAFLIGDADAKRILVDPSPANEKEYAKLKNTLASETLDGLFITHHHADHHEFAPELAKEYGVPLYMGEDCFERIKGKHREDYFQHNTVCLLREGETLTTWLHKPVKLIALPGHDEGLLGLAPESMEWMIVSDLIQTIGTVVIGGDEGDMKKYFESLKKVIALSPKIIFPSHGMPLRGVWKIQQTLKHREQRECEVQKCLDDGLDSRACLEHIYPDLKDALKPYALMTIEAHIKKIEQEQ